MQHHQQHDNNSNNARPQMMEIKLSSNSRDNRKTKITPNGTVGLCGTSPSITTKTTATPKTPPFLLTSVSEPSHSVTCCSGMPSCMKDPLRTLSFSRPRRFIATIVILGLFLRETGLLFAFNHCVSRLRFPFAIFVGVPRSRLLKGPYQKYGAIFRCAVASL